MYMYVVRMWLILVFVLYCRKASRQLYNLRKTTRREDHQRRKDRRRQLGEETDRDKENRRMAEECKKESQEMTAEGLLRL